jgi:hypothetical protein
MAPFSKMYAATAMLFSLSFFAFGQSNDNVTFDRNSAIFKIDSICKSIDENKNLVEGIIEGGYYNKEGGWAMHDLKSKNGDTLFRIRHESSTDFYYKTRYYYRNKQVIKGVIEIEDWNSGPAMKRIYSATYYFDNGKLVKALNEDREYSNASDMLKEGQSHQTYFYNNK